MRFFNEWFSDMNHVTKKAIAFTLAGIIIFTVGFASGTYSNINALLKSDELVNRLEQAASNNSPAPVETTPAPVETTATPQADTTAPSADTTDTAISNETDTTVPAEAPVAPTDNGGAQSGAPVSPAEIIAYYNESANKIKTNASSVTRNWEDLQNNEEYLEVPSILQSIGKTLLNTYLKKDETPITWSSKEDIIANYPVKGQTYVSNATEADLANASCQDDGTYYNITLEFKECTDPQGSGCDSAFNVIRAEEVKDAAKVVSEFSIRYYDAKIECKVEKATGNIVSATYTLPMVMSVKAMGVNAKVGMTFIDDYSISY